MRPMGHRRDRGQAYTLEGVVGTIIVAAALVLGLQVVDLAPWADPGDRELERLEQEAADVLDAAQDDGRLGVIAACVDSEGEPGTVAPGTPPDTAFERLLRNTLEQRMAYAIELDYPDESAVRTEPLTERRPPTQPTAATTRRVTLFDSDPVREGASCRPGGETLAENDEFYLEDQDEESELYGVVTVRVIVW